MRPLSIANLSLFALISPVLASSNAPPQAPPPQQGTVLHPINIADYEASMGLQRRDSNDLSTLDPQTQSELLYGSPGDNGQLLLANMTLYAPDGLPIVLLERFELLNVSVKCQDDEGVLSLVFASEDAFDYAVKQWGYVNEADDGKFLLIANKDGCGIDGQRQPYIVSNITEDDVTLTTSLAARMVPWSEVAGSYELNFGHAISIHQHKHLRDRNWWDNVENAGNDTENAAEAALDTAEGNYNKSQSASFPISAGQPNQRTTIFTDSRDGVTIDCTNCFVNGSLEFTGYVLVQNFKLQDLILTASPKSLFAALELEAIITADDGPDSLGHIWNLPNIPIPDLGISIAHIMNIGVNPTYSVGVNGSFGGSATVDFGLQATVPDSAQIVADYNNQGASTATGFSGVQPIPSFNIINESAFVTLSAFSQLGITFGVDLFELGGVDVALTVKLPEVSATFTAKHGKYLLFSISGSKTGLNS
ncbi:MAG: hypothetical protein ALECFALPRED_009642 [Alectoria fallacina]|uniref:Uncharacterized protein n=1 Tax=Alectoria fallacina TaxID=1903189 RepID=A0A8H3J7X9_9LECA|nr:MAG: hypothetical protein ALECFALPRED_009642 [Alectoria fallacina]